MQAPTSVLIALARLHIADHDLQTALEVERDDAQLDYDRLAALPDGAGNDHTAMLLQMADERGYCARRALRALTKISAAPQPQDLGYDAVVTA